MDTSVVAKELYSIFMAVCSYVFYQYCAGLIFEFRFQGKYKSLHILWITIVQLIPGFILKATMPNESVIRFFLILVTTTIGFILPYKGKVFHKILFYVVIAVIEYPVEIICMNLILILKIPDIVESNFYFLQTVVYLMIYPFVMLAVWVAFIGRKWNRRISTFILLPIYQLMIVAILFLLYDIPDNLMMIIGSAFALFDVWLNIRVIHIFEDVMKQIETEEKMDMLKRQRKYEWEYYRSINRSIEDMRMIRHDFQNQLQTAKFLNNEYANEEIEGNQLKQRGMIKCKEEMEFLVDKTREMLSEFKSGHFVEHPVADALLTLKKEEAESQNIKFEIKGKMGKDVKLSNVELCSVLGNLLDNAIEACSKNEGISKWICIELDTSEENCMISCLNSCEKEPKMKNGKWITSKGGKDHGKGMKTLERICTKYGGGLDKSFQNQVVTIKVGV